VVVVGAAFAVFAAPGVAAKESAEMATAVATAIVKIVFMFGLPSIGFSLRRTCAPYPRIQLNKFSFSGVPAPVPSHAGNSRSVMHMRVKPSVKAAAERLAQEDGRSLANWLERLIEAEAARREGKK
jgi:hypothetical protein